MLSALITVSPLAGNEVHFRSMSGDEEMGRPFEYIVEVLSKSSTIKAVDALGQPMTVSVQLPDLMGFRYFNGFITRFSQVGMFGNFHIYRAVLHPWLWFLGQASDCRIFQNRSVVEVVTKIFQKYTMALFAHKDLEKPGEDYPPRDYTVQYRETDLNFVSRLLEEVGIAYHFDHGPTSHTLVLTDSVAGRKHQVGYEKVSLRLPTEAGHSDCLTSWQATQEVKTAGYVLRDFDYLKAGAPLVAQRIPGEDKNRVLAGEFYDYPGRCLTQKAGDASALIRLNEAQSFYETIQASGPVRGIGTGNIFKLIDVPWGDGKEYLIVRAHYELRGRDPESGDGDHREVFHCALSLIDSQVPFRPARRSSRPVVQGPHTAIVVGPKKDDDNPEEIWTDDFGRVLVRFHWERLGRQKPGDPGRADDDADNLSKPCFVRVASLWAGKQWGIQFTPRIGQEVMVEFLEGDPDRPIVTGRVYNSVNMPPYTNTKKTQSGIKTHSTTGAGPDNFNEIRFEDKKGSEELFIQAEKDQNTKVKHDQSISVGGNRGVSVGGNETIGVTGTRSSTITKKETQTFKAEREMTVALADTETITGKHTGTYHAGREQTVESGDVLTVQASDKTTTVHGTYDITADTQFQVTQGSNTLLIKEAVDVNSVGDIHLHNPKSSVELKDGVLTITSATEIVLECGSAKISLKNDGTITIDGSQKIAATGGGSGLELSAPGATMSGTKATVSGTAMTEITGGMVKIN